MPSVSEECPLKVVSALRHGAQKELEYGNSKLFNKNINFLCSHVYQNITGIDITIIYRCHGLKGQGQRARK